MMIPPKEFLHDHPGFVMNLDPNHVVVDKEDWERARDMYEAFYDVYMKHYFSHLLNVKSPPDEIVKAYIEGRW